MDTAMIVSCPTRLSYILTSREQRNIAQRCATAMMILTTRFLFGAVHISGWRAGPIWSKSATTALVPPQFGQIFSVTKGSACLLAWRKLMMRTLKSF